MVLVVTNPLVGLNPVLRDGKIGFNEYFCGYRESLQDNYAGATMGICCRRTKDPKGGGKFSGKA